MYNDWCGDYENLLGLALWLDDECGEFGTAAEVIYFFEKPWKWSREFSLWQFWLAVEEMEPKNLYIIKEAICEAVLDGSTVEDIKLNPFI